MWIEVYQIHGQDFTKSTFFCGEKNFLQDTCGSGSAVRRSKQLPDTDSFVGLKFVRRVKSSSEEGKGRMGHGEAKAR